MNLIKADLYKLMKDTPVKIVLIVMVGLNFFTLLIFKVMQLLMPETAGMAETFAQLGAFTYYSLFALGNLGLYVALSVCLLMGKDFSYNTIRGKITGGNSRLKIYVSTLAVNLIVCAIFFAVTLIEGTLGTLVFFGKFSELSVFLGVMGMSAVLYIGFTGMMTFVGMLVRSQIQAIVFNILIVVLVPSLISVLTMVNMTTLNSDVLTVIIGATPFGIIGDLTGGTVMSGTLRLDGMLWLKAVLSTVVLGGGSSVLGYLLFNRADIK